MATPSSSAPPSDTPACENRIRWQSLVDNVLDGIITISEDGLVDSFNPAAARIFGYDAGEVVGQNASLLMAEPYHSAHDGYIRRYLDTGEAHIIGIGREVEGRRKDGTTFPMDLAVSEMKLPEGRFFIGIVRDITERKEIERMKQELIASISHELRTPLTSIRGALGLLEGGVAGPLSDKALHLVQLAHSNSRHLGRLVDDILDVEKLRAGRMSFSFAPLDLRALIGQAVNLNQSYAAQYDITLSAEALPDTPCMVNGDAVRLLQVLANILSNAVKFSPAGSKVRLGIERLKNHIRVSVGDSGPGIPEAFRPHVFEKFTQADSTDTRQSRGTGLGLPIAQHIVQSHGGTIDFLCPAEGGTVFFFDLPEYQESNP